jgi:hypothetical protein
MYFLARTFRARKIAATKSTKKPIAPNENWTAFWPATCLAAAENPGFTPQTCAHCLLLVIAEP